MKKFAGDINHFTHVYQKWQSYDIWFFRYEMQRTIFFCHFGPFFALLPPQPKKTNFEKLKKILGITFPLTSIPKIMVICYTFP